MKIGSMRGGERELELAAVVAAVDELVVLAPDGLVEAVRPAAAERGRTGAPRGAVAAIEAEGGGAGEVEVGGGEDEAAGDDVDGVAGECAQMGGEGGLAATVGGEAADELFEGGEGLVVAGDEGEGLGDAELDEGEGGGDREAADEHVGLAGGEGADALGEAGVLADEEAGEHGGDVGGGLAAVNRGGEGVALAVSGEGGGEGRVELGGGVLGGEFGALAGGASGELFGADGDRVEGGAGDEADGERGEGGGPGREGDGAAVAGEVHDASCPGAGDEDLARAGGDLVGRGEGAARDCGPEVADASGREAVDQHGEGGAERDGPDAGHEGGRAGAPHVRVGEADVDAAVGGDRPLEGGAEGLHLEGEDGVEDLAGEVDGGEGTGADAGRGAREAAASPFSGLVGGGGGDEGGLIAVLEAREGLAESDLRGLGPGDARVEGVGH
jgi:hypothetical protein